MRYDAKAAVLLDLCREKSLTLATVESCTGGLIAAALTEIAGSSDVFLCGFVTYSNQAKETMVGVQDKTLLAKGAVSEETAREMAMGGRSLSKADIVVSVTGIAGPGGGTKDKPVGTVCFSLARAGNIKSWTILFKDNGRASIRDASVDFALDLLLEAAKSA
ncbi:MAG: CinA family protein [Sphingomonadales bacterium]|jgi:nicotinamide-nucleotide amidase